MTANTEVSTYPQVFRQLANPTKWAICQYLDKARFATISVVQRKCSVSQSLASRYLRDLTAAGLVVKVRIGSVRLYEINQCSWVAVGRCVKALDSEVPIPPKVSAP